MLKMSIVLLCNNFLMVHSSQLAKLIEHIVFTVISQPQNKIQLAFCQLNAFNMRLQLIQSAWAVTVLYR